MRYKFGVTRNVFLVGRYAIKLPAISSWRLFLQGLLCNMQEAEFSTMKWDTMCPVLLSSSLGFVVVMQRVETLTFEEAEREMETMKAIRETGVPVELKPDSFGWLNGRIVAIDYGS